MITKIETLTNLVLRGERRKAETFLCNIENENECRGYCVALEKILLTEVAKNLNDTVAEFYIDCDKLKEALFSDNPPTRKTVLDTFRDILCEAAEKGGRTAFSKAKNYIEKNISDNQLSVASVAEYTGLSQSELVKLFRENADMKPGEYINGIRVRNSLSYLEKGMSISQVSEKTGYSSTETFIRAFKKQMGTTPGLWKRNKLFL